MLTYIFLWILVLIIGTAICFSILRSIAKTGVIIIFIIILFIAITMGLTYSDINEFQKDAALGEKIILLRSNEQLTFSTVQTGWGEQETYSMPVLNDEELQKLLDNDNLKQIKISGEYDKVIIIDTEIFRDTEHATLLSVVEDSSANYDARTFAFTTLETELLEEKGLFYFIGDYKEGNIIIYPNTMFFYIIRFFPETLIEKIINK